jgi:hypothetical protein
VNVNVLCPLGAGSLPFFSNNMVLCWLDGLCIHSSHSLVLEKNLRPQND